MKKPRYLTQSFVDRISTPGYYGDSRGSYGLALRVKPLAGGRGVSKSWIVRVPHITAKGNASYTSNGIGGVRHISLDDARERAKALQSGRGNEPVIRTVTFETVLDAVIETRRDGWKDGGKSEKQWRSTVNDYVLPVIGSKPIHEITTTDCLKVLNPIWHKKPDLALKIRQRINAVMERAVGDGYRAENPAGKALNAVLPEQKKNGKKNHPALPYNQVSRALTIISGTKAHWATKLALEFLTLTACRSGEVRAATWEEIDLREKTWTIPGERTKTRMIHHVPLSRGALGVLKQAGEYGRTGLIFPSIRGKEMSDNTLSKLNFQPKSPCI